MARKLFMLSEKKMKLISPYLPKPRGKPRVDERFVLSGIIAYAGQAFPGTRLRRSTGTGTRCTSVPSDGRVVGHSTERWQDSPPRRSEARCSIPPAARPAEQPQA